MRIRDAGVYPKALQLYRKIIVRAPEHWKAIYNVAYCLMRLRRIDDAMEVFEDLARRLSELSNSSKGTTKILASCYNEIASISDQKGNFEGAYNALSKAFEIDPTDFLVHLNLMITCAKLGGDRASEAHAWFLRLRSESFSDFLQQIPKADLYVLEKFPWFVAVNSSKQKDGVQ